MRYVVYGVGAIGGVLGAALHASGHDVVLIARGRHLELIRDRGLQVDRPDGSDLLRIAAFGHPGEVGVRQEDIVLLTMKSQDTAPALQELAASADSSVPVMCVQNGVHNERQALRRFQRVFGVCVMCPAMHLEPGVVRAYSSPVLGILDIGCYPSGADEIAETTATALRASGFSSEVQTDIMRWKYGKLLQNLGNVIEAACGSAARRSPLADMARREGEASLRAAGIQYVSTKEDADRRGELLELRPVEGAPRPGGSSWQSLRRGTGTIETDYLNGEIVLLGRLNGISTPANEILQTVGNEMALSRLAPGSVSMDDLLARAASLG